VSADGVDARRFEPRADPLYQYLMEGAADGSVPVYAVEASFSMFKPHDPFWGPEQAPDGIRTMKAVMARIGQGENLRPWVYPRDGRLIYADDYFLMACWRMLKVDAIRAWHLLTPAPDLPAHGPIPLDNVRSLIAGSVITVRS
jgi:hypothetical protein